MGRHGSTTAVTCDALVMGDQGPKVQALGIFGNLSQPANAGQVDEARFAAGGRPPSIVGQFDQQVRTAGNNACIGAILRLQRQCLVQ